MSSLRNLLLLVATTLALGGCGFGYYWQASMGHLGLMRERVPVADVVADPATPGRVRAQLELASEALVFAHDALGLPDNGSYRTYAATGREYVVWNVVATPEFSLAPLTWCFPVAGCVSYRGYFARDDARAFAAGLADEGNDVTVRGAAAYSTLGRFEDPLLDTMMGYADYQLVGLIFHELAHQRLYVRDDSAFNESFASFVEREGVRRWYAAHANRAAYCRYLAVLARGAEVRALLAVYRARLEHLYATEPDLAVLRARKAAIFAELGGTYRSLRAGWDGPPYFDSWFAGPPNNARLAALATYDTWVPAFAQLYVDAGEDLPEFYTRAAQLAPLSAEARRAALDALARRSGGPPAAGCDE